MINTHYQTLPDNYLFAAIARKVREFEAGHPGQPVIRMGIGDVTRPLAPAVVEAMREAAAEMGCAETFRGYDDAQGYPFLKEAVAVHYARLGVAAAPDEILISDGAKSDAGNLLDIFSPDCVALIPDPVYPVYVDTNRMDGRAVRFMDATPDNGFLPMPDASAQADIIYLCSPNNPTGAAYNRDQLAAWVAYARERGAVILFDAAYEAFAGEAGIPRSIYEIEGARECAIEVGSLSKMAGFTGVRCGWTLVPPELVRDGVSLRQMWLRRQNTKFNGVSYITQRGAAAALSPEGLAQCRENIDYYRENARLIAGTMDALGIAYTGGRNSPYIWLECPGGDSWAFFDRLLERAQVVGTPGAGFGQNGEGFFRLSSFGTHENTRKAMRRFRELGAGG